MNLLKSMEMTTASTSNKRRSRWGSGAGEEEEAAAENSRSLSIQFRGQGTYSHGTCMCTSACLQFAMAVLCRKVNLLCKTEEETAKLRSCIDSIMALASQSHAKLEKSTYSARMVSVHEIIQESNIDLRKLTIELEELFMVFPAAAAATSCLSSTLCELAPSKKGHPMKYRASSCFLKDLSQLPACMESAEEETKNPSSTVAIATSNGHTVCLVHCCSDQREENDFFAFFDPLPGLLCIGISESKMLDMLCETLRLPTNFDAPSPKYHCRRRMSGSSGAEDMASSSSSSTTMDILTSAARALLEGRGKTGHSEQQQQQAVQHCDISLLYRMKPTTKK